MARIAPTGRPSEPVDHDAPDVTYDGGHTPYGPAAPNPMIPPDAVLASELRQHREQAHKQCEAHRAELQEQIIFHEQEIARMERIVYAVDAALGNLEPEEQAAYSETHTMPGYPASPNQSP